MDLDGPWLGCPDFRFPIRWAVLSFHFDRVRLSVADCDWGRPGMSGIRRNYGITDSGSPRCFSCDAGCLDQSRLGTIRHDCWPPPRPAYGLPAAGSVAPLRCWLSLRRNFFWRYPPLSTVIRRYPPLSSVSVGHGIPSFFALCCDKFRVAKCGVMQVPSIIRSAIGKLEAADTAASTPAFRWDA
jgi:hypothetical protein